MCFKISLILKVHREKNGSLKAKEFGQINFHSWTFEFLKGDSIERSEASQQPRHLAVWSLPPTLYYLIDLEV